MIRIVKKIINGLISIFISQSVAFENIDWEDDICVRNGL